MKKIVLFYFLFFISLVTKAQSSFVWSCSKDTVLSCSQNCISLKAYIPNLHSTTDDYAVGPINPPAQANCFTPGIAPDLPGNPTNLNLDDTYTDVINIPFDFPFYGIIYASLVISTNGVISFDLTNATGFAHYSMLSSGTGLTATGTGPGVDLPDSRYDRAVIMGIYEDINPFYTTSPNQQIKYDIIGAAPNRKFILSFYKVPTYLTACQNKINNSYQITLYEGTGIVDIHVFGREICTGWNQGRAMIGMQNYDQDKGVMPPGRAASTNPLWGGPVMNEAWRFTPKGGPSAYKKVELQDVNGNFIALGDTVSVGDKLEVTFPNVCPTASLTKYVVKSTFSDLLDPSLDIIGTDTISVIKTGTLAAIAENITPAPCGVNTTGTITVTAPVGAPVKYSIDGGVNFQSSPVFTKAPGTYTVIAKDTVTGCTNSKDEIIPTLGTLTAVSASTTNASCPGALNGTITVTASFGTPGYTYAVDTSANYQSSNLLDSLGEGTHTVYVKDNGGCIFSYPHVIGSDDGFTTTAASANASCIGVANGTITVVQPSTGAAPFYYSIPGVINTPQTSTLLDSLAAGSYTVKVVDAVGCAYSFPQAVVNSSGIDATFITINAACLGVSTGQIVVTATAGAAPFFYSIDTGLNYQPLDTFRNLASGNYSIQIKDAVGCIYTSGTQVVSNNPGFTTTASSANASCLGVSNGSITVVQPAAGTAPFSYSIPGVINTPQPSPLLAGLAATSYTVKVADANGCNYTFSQAVASNPGVTATDSTVKSNCAVATTGKIFVKTGLGVAPFVFSKDSGVIYQPADSFINLAPGIYHIRVRDNVGCYYDFNSTVGIGAGVTATDSTVKSNCAIATTGKIFVKTGLGVAPFVFSKDSGVINQPADSFINLAPGIYHIRVRDNVGCYYDFNSTVGIGTGVTATDSTVKSNCAVATTGKIFVKTGLGVAPFVFSKDSGAIYQPADSFINLAPGIYHIRVRDIVGCYYDFNSTVGIGAGVTATDSTVKSACASVATGKIFVKTGLGVAPFFFSKDSGAIYQPADSFIKLAPSIYHIRVKDAVGCFHDFNSTVGFNPGVNASFIKINSACLGISTGQIVVTPIAGISPFNYSIDTGSNYQPLDTFKNLASGNYSILITDAVGCIYNSPTQIVGNDPGVTASYRLVKSACAGAATGAIIVTPNSGTATFKYSIDGGAKYQYDSVFRNLPASAYNIRVVDTAGCILNSPVQNIADNPGVLTSPSTIQNSSCATIPNGAVTVNVTAGILPYSYTMISVPGSAPQTNNIFAGLFSGSYDITITDSAGCSKTITSVIGNNPKIKIDSLNIVRPTCNGLLNGTIKVNASLGVAPYQYAIDAGAYTNNKTFTGVGAGSHTLHISDANGCVIDSIISITEPTTLTNSLVSTASSTCSGNPDGEIVVSAAGGTLPYQYTLDAATNTGYQPATVFPVIAGSYKVTVQDAKACKTSINVTVDSVFTMFLDLGADTTICVGQTVTFRPNTNAQTSIFTYTPAATINDASLKNAVATATDTTKYKLVAQWGICKLTDSVVVNVLHKPLPNAGADAVICFDTTTVLSATASNLSGTVNYVWSPANLLDGSADTTVVIARPDTTQTFYTVIVTDNYGCNFSVTDQVLVTMLPPVYAFAGNDTNAVIGVPHQLNATGAGVGGTYQWYYPSGVSLSNDLIANPTAMFEFVPQPGSFHPDNNYYTMSVLATNQAGCQETDTVKINVFIGPAYYCPNAFSPNGDGTNDIFRAIQVGMASTEYFRIYNRYGELVFATNQFMKGWDGTFKGKPQLNGAYVWAIKGKDRNGIVVEKKGTVMLIR